VADAQRGHGAGISPEEDGRGGAHRAQGHGEVLQQGVEEPNHPKRIRPQAEVAHLKGTRQVLDALVLEIRMDG
jgi:hypothetical protein